MQNNLKFFRVMLGYTQSEVAELIDSFRINRKKKKGLNL